jgi:hypothetical protein
LLRVHAFKNNHPNRADWLAIPFRHFGRMNHDSSAASPVKL